MGLVIVLPETQSTQKTL